MKPGILLLIGAICLSAAVNASAQACGSFRIEITVGTLTGQPIENAEVQFLPITTDETFGRKFVRNPTDRSRFSAEFEEGRSAREFQRLIVSAKGYKTAANEIKFYSCSKLRIAVSLAANSSAGASEWSFTNWLTVETADESGGRVDGTKITVMRAGEVVRSEFIEYSGTRIELPNGEYTVRIEKDGYETEEIAADLSRIADVKVRSILKPKP